ncbi:MAG TPA: carbohydrate kinase family protein [Syntrophobacteraceae bacterium]|nr:carbohydrate kinase family protein [Syntrophobacteraceae bacterium]
MNIFISGSLAYDRIMDFPGRFVDHILPEKIHVLNVCFNINGLVEKFGGTAGNIAYSLAVLGESPFIVATWGRDFSPYEKWLLKNSLPTACIKAITSVLTACAYITTDRDDNQITAFNPGAMAFEADLPVLDGSSMVFIGPGNKMDMMNFSQKARLAGAPFFFDPGQSLNIWNDDELREAVRGALCFISNDYELSLFLRMTGWAMKDLYKAVGVVITTKGSDGVVIDPGGDKLLIPAVPVRKVVDPTGAGDAFRAGVLKAKMMDLPWDIACQVGAAVASFSVEHYGTQEHSFTWEQFCERYSANYGALVC